MKELSFDAVLWLAVVVGAAAAVAILPPSDQDTMARRAWAGHESGLREADYLAARLRERPQEARYLRCESPDDLELYSEIRDELPQDFVEDWVDWNRGCSWVSEIVSYDGWWEVEDGVTCFTPPYDPDAPIPEDPVADGYFGCSLTDEWRAFEEALR